MTTEEKKAAVEGAFPDAREALAALLGPALKAEFSMMKTTDDIWHKVARGVILKLPLEAIPAEVPTFRLKDFK